MRHRITDTPDKRMSNAWFERVPLGLIGFTFAASDREVHAIVNALEGVVGLLGAFPTDDGGATESRCRREVEGYVAEHAQYFDRKLAEAKRPT